MNPVFGIHVGNSTACLAIYKQDDTKFCVEVIANNAGDRVMPAIVTVTENENVVGAACKSLMISRWNTTVTCNKRMLNRDSPDGPTNGERKVKTVMRDGELNYALPLDGGESYMTPTEIATCIYSSLYDIAKSAVPGDDSDISCVLMVPKHFSEEARLKVQNAAESVGWDVLHVINEPAAAALGYNLLSNKSLPPAENVLVYRVGGRSCDATVIGLSHGMISILDEEHSDELGGRLVISSLTAYLAEEFNRRYRLDPKDSHRALTKLTLAAEECIHVLSTIESANCFVESLCEGVDFNYNMSRARFESLLFPFLNTFARPIHKVLDRQQLDPSNVTMVLLCGGLLKIPRLKQYISSIFQDSSTKIVTLPNGINYDEVLAYGAALQAGYIAMDKMGDNFLPSDVEIPVLELPVLVEVEGAECEPIEFEAGQPLPVSRTVVIRPQAAEVTVTFSQDESFEIVLRGQVQLAGLQDPTEVVLEIDRNSAIKVSVPDGENAFTHHTVRLFAYPK